MSLIAAVGQASAIDGREASAQAVRQALSHIERDPIILAWIFASHDYPVQSVLGGAAPILGDIPMIGMSTQGEITHIGATERSVVVALLAGERIQAQAHWWPDITRDEHAVTQGIVDKFGLHDASPDDHLFLVADGLAGDYRHLSSDQLDGAYTIAGGLAGGGHQAGKTYQIGGTQGGSGGLGGAFLRGEIKAGIYCANAWQAIGAFYQVTSSDGPWVRTLDGQPATEIYASLFGYPVRDWAFPPLNELIRLYPLGVEEAGGDTLLVRSPIRVEADGSLRMSAPVPEGSTCFVLTGSAGGCVTSASLATQRALSDLGDSQPTLALVMADVAWKLLLEAQPGQMVNAVREVVGDNVPIAGGYTYGQITRSPSSGRAEVLNQHIQVLILGAPT